jgi:hypothetical protein
MCIYCNTTKYRKIYENHHGPIPKDEDGRTYEIHHIDGNHANNDYSNLKSVPIQEHYDIHYNQGDYGACSAILKRMSKSPEEIRFLGSELQKKRIESGTHNFQKRTAEERKHNAKKAVQFQTINEKNKLVGPDNNLRLKQLGIHPLIGGTASRKGVRSQLDAGTHASQRVYDCLICSRIIKGSANYKRHKIHCEKVNSDLYLNNLLDSEILP